MLRVSRCQVAVASTCAMLAPSGKAAVSGAVVGAKLGGR